MPFRFYSGSRTVFRKFAASAIAIGVALLAAPSVDAQWRVDPSIGAGLEYDDNSFLIGGPFVVSPDWGYAMEADARVSYNSQLTEFALTPRYLGTRFDGFSELDSDEWFLNLDYLYTGQLSSFRVRGSYTDESIRRAERSNVDFDVQDPTEIPNDQSGQTLGTEKRQRIHLAPDWSYRTGERSLIRLGASYLDVAYDAISNPILRDYTEALGLASFEYGWSPRNSLVVSGYYRENEFDRISGNFSGYGLTLGITRAITENTRFVINAGVDSTEDQFAIEHTNPIGEISFTRKFQTSRILAAYRRTVTGSGSSELSVRDTISMVLTRNVSEKFSASAGVHAYQTSALDKNATNFDEQDYRQFRALFTYNFSRVFSVDLDYRYTEIDREISTPSASANIVNLWFRYRSNR